MVWYGMVWYGMVWYGMVWYGVAWYGVVWCGVVWYGVVAPYGGVLLGHLSFRPLRLEGAREASRRHPGCLQGLGMHSAAAKTSKGHHSTPNQWCAVVWWYGGVVWYGMVWYGMVWYGVVWCGVVWLPGCIGPSEMLST